MQLKKARARPPRAAALSAQPPPPHARVPPPFPPSPNAALTRDSRHKRRATGGKRHPHQKKRKFEIARPPAMTKLGPKRIHEVRGRGGNTKRRAIRLEMGNFSWGSEKVTKQSKVIDVLYNASNNELVRTKTLVKGAVVQIDGGPFVTWHKNFYHQAIKKGEKGGAPLKESFVPEGVSKGKDGKTVSAERKAAERQKTREVSLGGPPPPPPPLSPF